MDKANEDRDDPVGDALRAGQLPSVDAETRELHEEVMSLLWGIYSCTNGLIHSEGVSDERKSELEEEKREVSRKQKTILSKANEDIRIEIESQRDRLRSLQAELLSTPDPGLE